MRCNKWSLEKQQQQQPQINSFRISSKVTAYGHNKDAMRTNMIKVAKRKF
jgi:hypothetical protein